jgi:hypothetical protein
MRIIYNACFADPWLKVAKELKEKYDFEPVYWIGFKDDDSANLVPAVFPNAIYHPIFDAWKGIFSDRISKHYAHSHINIDFLRAHATFELQALKMMDRMDADCHSFSFSERQRHYRNFIKNWTACIDLLKPELVVNAYVPHHVYDYVLYLLCRHLNIPYIIFRNTAFTGRTIVSREIFSIGNKIISDYESIMEQQPDFNMLKANLALDILACYQNTQKDYERGKPAYMATNELQHKQSSNAVALSMKFISDIFHDPAKYFGRKGYLLQGFPTYLKRKNKSIEESRLSIIQYSVNKIKANKYKRKLKNYYDSRTEKPDFTEPYVYLPLHYQPEMTSSPAGDIFVDQFLCVETLVKNIPDNWKIYVKEHPSQFQSHGEGQTSRIKEFYDDLIKFPNLRLMPFNADSFDLISNAKAVATVTGTVGWEAMVRRKPVLVFGSSWYEKYPGALKIFNEEAAGKIYDFIQNFIFDENKLLGYLAALEKNSLRAYYLPGLKEKMNQPEKECVENLVISIIRSIDRQ